MPRKTASAPTSVEFKFRGTWVPADLFHLLRSGTISPLDFVFLLQVDALVESGGKGCYASNRYFGTILGIDPRHVRRTVSKLADLKLVKATIKNRIRYLETSWSRVKKGGRGRTSIAGGEDIYSRGEGGQRCPPINTGTKKIKVRNREGASGASPPRHPPSAVADVTVLPGKSSTPAGVPVPVASPDGKEPVYDEYASKPRNPPGKVHLEMAASLLDYFKTAGRYPGRYDQKKWARELRSVAEFVGSDDTVWSVIEYLSTSHGAAWPTIGNTNQFCQRFDDLHQLMTKRVGVTVPDQPPAVQTVIQQCQEFLPAKAHPTLPACVTVSVVTVREFITGLSHLKDCHRPSKAGRVNATENYYRTEVLGHLLAKLTRDKPDVTVLRGVLRVVLDWVRFVGEKVRGWESWSGNMKGYAFALDHKDFPEFWERVLFQGDRKWLDRVRKELGE